ncbi:MAG: helix-turn-helix transcriptional regulator [Ruthenibacterium sp.]
MNNEVMSLFDSLSDAEKEACRVRGEVAVAIQRKRKELGLSQKEMAQKIHVSQGMISKWESGEYNFSISSLTEICEKFNMELCRPICKERKLSSCYDFAMPPQFTKTLGAAVGFPMVLKVATNEGA